MTELIYNHQFYNNFKNGDSVIIDRERKYIDEIINACRSTDLFVNSIWFENDNQLKELLDKKPKRAIIYSGMDWHDNGFRRSVHEEIAKNVEEIIYVGNRDGDGYFSFWVFFVEDFKSNFYKEDKQPQTFDKLYMCLNRKRHQHRVKLVDTLKKENIIVDGYVTLGGDPDNNIPPLTLSNDYKTTIGDNAAGDRREGIPNDITSTGKNEYWDTHLINIVTETTTSSETFISEKTWKPILGLKPFMILGDYKIYEYLKDYGIDTFDDIFGTGYKTHNENEKINWIVSNLKTYRGTDYSLLYNKLLPRLVKNRDMFEEVVKINQLRFNNILEKIK